MTPISDTLTDTDYFDDAMFDVFWNMFDQELRDTKEGYRCTRQELQTAAQNAHKQQEARPMVA